MIRIKQSIAIFAFIVLIVSCSKNETPTAPVATANPTAQTISTGESTSISLSSTITGTSFAWTVVQDNVSGAIPGSGSTIAHNLTLTSGNSGTATYTITPTANGVSGNAITVVITVTPGKITYLSHVKPIMVFYCQSCHVAGGSNPNKFDEYATTKNKINSILDRVQRDQGSSGFMPKSGTKLPADKIATLKKWMEDGLLEN